MIMTESASPVLTTHELLLALAGRVDDDLLASSRELVASGADGQALELLTATLVADRAALPPPVRAAVVAIGRALRIGLDAEQELPAAVREDGTPHRFHADAAPPAAVAWVGDVLAGPAAHQLAGRRSWLTWRRTPAGAAPGPLPHPVLLVEVDEEAGPDAHTAADVLAYQLATILHRAGAPASVEAFVAGSALPGYHAEALSSARPVPAETGRRQPAVGGAEHGSVGSARRGVRGPDVPPGKLRSAGGPDPQCEPGAAGPVLCNPALNGSPGPRSAEPAAPAVDAGRAVRRGPVGAVPTVGIPTGPASAGECKSIPPAAVPTLSSAPRLDRTPAPPATALRSVSEPQPGGDPEQELNADEPGCTIAPADEDDAYLAPLVEMNDPFSGPLQQPLLDPLLDPTVGSAHAVPQVPPEGPGAERAADKPRQSWAHDWVSGAWAMPSRAAVSSSVPSPTATNDEPAVHPSSSSGVGQRRARHRSDPDAGADVDPIDPAAGPRQAGFPPAETPRAEAPQTQPAAQQPAGTQADDSDPMASLTGTERELLRLLHAELIARERKPPTVRPTAAANAGPNGSAWPPRLDRPDQAS